MNRLYLMVVSLCCVVVTIQFYFLFNIIVQTVQHKDNAYRLSDSLAKTDDMDKAELLPRVDNICKSMQTVHLRLIKKTKQDVQWIPQIPFIPGLKNPCFCVSVTKDITRLRCLPYFFLAGFPKCGTTDLFSRLSQHPHLKGPGKVKELHFWDNAVNIQDYSLGRYSSHLKNATNIIGQECEVNVYDCPYIAGDFTPRTVYHADSWEDEAWNLGHMEPKYSTAHKIHRLLPNAKIILMLRDPADRLFSDYRYSLYRNGSSSGFHLKVQQALNWWANCTAVLSERACAYGVNYPPGVAPLGRTNCAIGTACHPKVYNWKSSSGDRLRISLYALYIQDWLSVFGKDNILFIKFEEYKQNPDKIIAEQVLPYLNLTGQYPRPEDSDNRHGDIKNMNIVQYPMFSETRQLLNAFFRPYNRRLQELLVKNGFQLNMTSYGI